MILTAPKARHGLSAYAASSRPNVVGSNRIGTADRVVPLTGADIAYSLSAIICSGSSLSLDQPLGEVTAEAWVAGVAQIETATAAGTITTAGNLSCIVTSAGMAGSPKTVTVAVALNDTASLWAAKVRTALAADSAVNGRFVVSGTGTAIILTRRPAQTLTLNGVAYPIQYAADATLNMALADVTSAGCTEAATSAATAAGTQTTGVLVEGDNLDFEGRELSDEPVSLRMALEVSASSDDTAASLEMTGDMTFTLSPGTVLSTSNQAGQYPNSIEFAGVDYASVLDITLIGQS